MRLGPDALGLSCGRRAKVAAAVAAVVCGASTRAGALRVRRRQPQPAAAPLIDRGDLAAIESRRVLRVLMDPGEVSVGEVARGEPAERGIVAEFARSRGWRVQYVEAHGADELMALLRAGLGDVIGTGLAVSAARRHRVAFTRPIAVEKEFVVGSRTRRGPSSPGELARWEIDVPRGGAAEDTARRLGARTGGRLRVVRVEGAADDDTIARDVAAGRRPLTIVEGRSLARLRREYPVLRPLFPVARERRVALATRPDNPLLRAALDAYLSGARHRPAPDRRAEGAKARALRH